MNFQTTKLSRIIIFSLIFGVLASAVSAQVGRTESKPTLVINQERERMPVAGFNNLYCAGFVQTAPVDTSWEIVGASDEDSQRVYVEGDLLYINGGAARGVKVGDMFSVVRPRGRVETRWTYKKNLGFYVQELGVVEVVDIKPHVSIVRVKTSCDNLLLGDLLQPFQKRESPIVRNEQPLDLFATQTVKVKGRIFMARDGQEMLSRNQVVYIDVGAEDNIRVGDSFMIYRPLGTGGIFDRVENESLSARDEGFQSDEYRGGKFSNQAGRKKGGQATGRVVTTEDAKSRRPPDLRKVLGELVILNVKEKTATAVIVRTTGEIHTGDRVQLQ